MTIDTVSFLDTDHKHLYRQLAQSARSYKGTAYHYGGRSQADGFDCSGFVQKLYEEIGISLPHSARLQSQKGKRVGLDKLRIGDLLFFSDDKTIKHVAMVIRQDPGQTLIAHATSSKGVIFEPLEASDYWSRKVSFAKRIL